MHTNPFLPRLSAVLILAGALANTTSLSAATLYAVTNTQQLVRFDSATPGSLSSTAAITGMGVGETVLGIDFRPATGELLALGSASRLYRINLATGAATAIGSAGAFTLNGTAFGFDFNPTVDRIRVVSDAEQNLRLNPVTAALSGTDTNLAYAVGDPNAAQIPDVVAAAYTNSFAGGTTTTLFGIDTTLDLLVTQVPPNNGTLNSVGSLGVNAVGGGGFDILTTGPNLPAPTNQAFATLSTNGTSSALYAINLTTGAASLIGNVSPLPVLLTALAVEPPGTFVFSTAEFAVSEGATQAAITINRVGGSTGTVSVAFSSSDGSATAAADYTDSDQTLQFSPGQISAVVTIPLSGNNDATWQLNKTVNLALTNATGSALLGVPASARLSVQDDEAPNAYAITSGNQLVRFNLASPQTFSAITALSGTVSSEVVVGLDSRPATREFFGLGAGSRLYRIDAATAAATQIGVDGAFTLSGTRFGFDFNPTVDRLRVVSDNGQNLRLNPITGVLAATDVSLAYAVGDVNQGLTPFVIGSGYTNSVAGTPGTTLYGIDASANVLVIQSPPNNGTLVTVGALGIDALDPVGFDLASTGVGSDLAYAVLSTGGGASSLYSIDLVTGAAARVGPVGATATLVHAFAIDDPHLFRNGFE